jgi:hypothetical protein
VGGFPGFAVFGFDDLLLGLDDDGFEILASAHTAGAAASGGAVIFVDPAGEFDQVLARGPMAMTVRSFSPYFSLKCLMVS